MSNHIFGLHLCSEKGNLNIKYHYIRHIWWCLCGSNMHRYCRSFSVYRRNNKWYHVSEHARKLSSSISWHANITHRIAAYSYFNSTLQESQNQTGGCQERFIDLHIYYIWVSKVYLFRNSLQDMLYSLTVVSVWELSEATT
jgi:hypothetical protein